MSHVFSVPAVLLSADVLSAFDEVPFELIFQAFLFVGLSRFLGVSLVREALFNVSRFKVPTAGTSVFLYVERGLKQGGIDSPDLWSAVLQMLLEPLLDGWKICGSLSQRPRLHLFSSRTSFGRIRSTWSATVWTTCALCFGS